MSLLQLLLDDVGHGLVEVGLLLLLLGLVGGNPLDPAQCLRSRVRILVHLLITRVAYHVLLLSTHVFPGAQRERSAVLDLVSSLGLSGARH